MKSSTSLKCFKSYVNKFDPEFHLGKTWKDILNFWIYIDKLTEDEWKLIEIRLPFDEYCNLIGEKAGQIHGLSYQIQLSSWNCPYQKYNLTLSAPSFATYELIASQELLKDGISLRILPLFINI